MNLRKHFISSLFSGAVFCKVKVLLILMLLKHFFISSLGALLKAAFFCAEILPLVNTGESLKDFLKQRYGSGFILKTWSNLPHGSGLGTSSILAGTVISALWTVVGFEHDLSSVLHAVSLISKRFNFFLLHNFLKYAIVFPCDCVFSAIIISSKLNLNFIRMVAKFFHTRRRSAIFFP